MKLWHKLFERCWLRLHLTGRYPGRYPFDLRIKRLHVTVWRRCHPAIAITLARPNCVEAGDAEEWAQWALWQDRAWGKFTWKRYGPMKPKSKLSAWLDSWTPSQAVVLGIITIALAMIAWAFRNR